MTDERSFRVVRRRILAVFVPLAIVLGAGWGFVTGSAGIGVLVGVAMLVAVLLGVWLMRSMPPFDRTGRG